MQEKLLAETVRVLTEKHPPQRETVIFDTVLPRFALRVRPSASPGRHSWPSLYFIRYVGPDGRERKLKVGSPLTMSLDEARKAARGFLAIVDQGGDPAEAKTALREQWSISQAVEAYLASADHRRKTDKVQQGEKSALRLHVVHRLAHLPLAQFDVPAARRLIRSIENDARSNARGRRMGGAGAARKTLRILSAVLSWCVGEGRLSRNPVIGALRLTGDGERETVISTTEEYAALFGSMDKMVADGELRDLSRAFIAVAALTGMRRGELQALRWRDVNLAERRITIIDSKGARLAKRGPKIEGVSLPAFAAAALSTIRPKGVREDDLVFVPRRGRAYAINRDWNRVKTAAALPADLALHGLRHSVGTVGIISGLSGPEVQKLLRHRNPTTTAKYIHLADRVRLQDRAMEGMAPTVLPKERETGT